MLYRLVLTISLIYLFVESISTERIRYDNYHVYRTAINTKAHLSLLQYLDNSSDSLIFLDEINISGRGIHIIAAPHKVPDLLRFFNKHGISYELIEKDAQSKLEDFKVEPRSEPYGWTSYYELSETYDWLKSLPGKYPGIVQVINAGKSYEGRSIIGVKISYGNGYKKKGIFVEGGIHAREWISPATVTYIINELLTSDDGRIRQIAEDYDWFFFPLTNPDGYAYTHSTNRLWRKTRSEQGLCYGVDPNRNWDYHWNEVGASSSSCSETYAGEKPFSEKETRALSQYITTLIDRLDLYLSFHSFSQLILFPYGHTSEVPPNNDDFNEISYAAIEAVGERYGTKYTGGNTYSTIYPTSGVSTDWAFAKAGINLTFTYELRPSSSSWNGFVLPPEEIIPTGEEILDSVIALIKKAKELKYL